MISSLFHSLFYNPIYNILITLLAFIPGGDMGIAVIVTTLLVRIVLLPVTLRAARAQRVLKTLEPHIKALKEKHKGDKETEALETWRLYREAQVNPFANFFILLIQIPILLALFWVFQREPFPELDMLRLYTFTPLPHSISMEFIGLLSVAGKSIFLAVLAGATQFFQARIALSSSASQSGGAQGDFQRVMNMQLTYVFPVIITVISYTTSGAVALYFITTNLAGALQEWYVRKTLTTPTVALQ